MIGEEQQIINLSDDLEITDFVRAVSDQTGIKPHISLIHRSHSTIAVGGNIYGSIKNLPDELQRMIMTSITEDGPSIVGYPLYSNDVDEHMGIVEQRRNELSAIGAMIDDGSGHMLCYLNVSGKIYASHLNGTGICKIIENVCRRISEDGKEWKKSGKDSSDRVPNFLRDLKAGKNGVISKVVNELASEKDSSFVSRVAIHILSPFTSITSNNKSIESLPSSNIMNRYLYTYTHKEYAELMIKEILYNSSITEAIIPCMGTDYSDIIRDSTSTVSEIDTFGFMSHLSKVNQNLRISKSTRLHSDTSLYKKAYTPNDIFSQMTVPAVLVAKYGFITGLQSNRSGGVVNLSIMAGNDHYKVYPARTTISEILTLADLQDVFLNCSK